MGYVIDTQVFIKINNVYGNPKHQLKLPKLYAHYHGNHNCRRGYQLLLISITLIFKNISQNAEQKMTVVRFQTCYKSSTEGTIHLEEPAAYYGVLA